MFEKVALILLRKAEFDVRVTLFVTRAHIRVTHLRDTFLCSAYGTLNVRSLLDVREQYLNEFSFPDPYAEVAIISLPVAIGHQPICY